MKIETWPLERIKPYPQNARKIPQRAVDKVAASLQEFSWQQPIVVDKKGVIVAGHTRLLAAQKLGLKQAPVHVAQNLTPAQIRAYRLADNRTNEETTWNLELLGPELQQLSTMKFDLGLTGFEMRELNHLLPHNQDEPEAQMDRAQELQAKWKVERGQVWEIGEHRLMCGDATALEDVAALLSGEKPFLMVTDPPYGVDYDPAWREENSKRRAAEGHKEWFNYNKAQVANDDRIDWSPAYALFPGDVAYVWHAGIYAGLVAASLGTFQVRAQIIWRKQVAVFGRGAYHWGHEPCWYAVRVGRSARWIGDHTQSTVWEVQNLNPVGGNRDEETVGHSTQKPTEIMRRPIQNHETQEVYDPFIGSGTTMVAAQQLERRCYGMEIEPKYCAVILERMSAMGLTPTRNL